ncbi:hypothetical protein GCM10027449_29130 [Sinomonas notoginsengisoli]|uniref:single-stranded DNA-binding protein n=1 Tax=Sinomonas notoginsengisoli TaxID=1457311 RepID=UPI001F298B44|nr:single-stranded DNA-binding protein [Sinomonas notoginsengisoli]
MRDTITLRGWVGTEPTKGVTKNNRSYSRFRMSVTDGYFDRDRQTWVNGLTSWYTVSCYGEMAENVAASIRKGQRTIVMGRLQIRTYQKADGTFGTDAEIVASSVGQDLAMGMGIWNRRKDEQTVTPLPARPANVEGIGEVDPATGEVRDDTGPVDPLGAELSEFDEACDYFRPADPTEGPDSEAAGDGRSRDGLTGEDRLLSA